EFISHNSSSEKLDNLLDGPVRFSISSLDSGCGFEVRLWRFVKEAVGQRAADSLVEENKHESGLVALFSQTVGVAFSVALQQAMVFQLANVVTELGQGVIVSLEMERLQDGLVNVSGAPAGNLGSRVKQHLHEADHPGVLDLDAGNAGFTRGDGQCKLLEQRVIHVNVEGLGFEGGEAVRDGG